MSTTTDKGWSKEFPSLKDGNCFWIRNTTPEEPPRLQRFNGGYSFYEPLGIVSPTTEYLGPVKPEQFEQLAALRATAVLMAIPYEALLADTKSRKWIAPEIWSEIEAGVAALREALGDSK